LEIVNAIAAGKRAAEGIDQYVRSLRECEAHAIREGEVASEP